jgi:hypothetical protein
VRNAHLEEFTFSCTLDCEFDKGPHYFVPNPNDYDYKNHPQIQEWDMIDAALAVTSYNKYEAKYIDIHPHFSPQKPSVIKVDCILHPYYPVGPFIWKGRAFEGLAEALDYSLVRPESRILYAR